MDLIEHTARIAETNCLVSVSAIDIGTEVAKERALDEYTFNVVNAESWNQSTRVPLTVFVFDASFFNKGIVESYDSE